MTIDPDIAIHVRGLGKKYTIGGEKEKYLTFRDAISNVFKNPFNRTDTGNEEFWALKDVSFDIYKGEVVGIIGRNGAGKSTLLKILSQITTPTEGEIDIYGRVGSLLEVGTGFHPELTGRENIFLSGSILGMRKREIEERFDNIVKFAEIEKFIETPVKRYSSGMYVRLAFAVAAHMDTEILLVDEVLAVGDTQFQKKCMGKMGDVATKEGRTVLFVSHNMGAIRNLTQRVIWLDKGFIKLHGATVMTVPKYLDEGYKQLTSWRTEKINNKPIQIVGADIANFDDFLDVKNEISFIIRYVVREPIRGSVISAIIHTSDGTPILSTEDIDLKPSLLDYREPGNYCVKVTIPGSWFCSGKYYLRLHSGIVYQVIFDNIEAISFDLIETGDFRIRQHKQAFLLPYLNWENENVSYVPLNFN